MNLTHVKYAVEVAKTHSISKAAENLYMNQPNLSRAIKELEESIGISIFYRTSRGISVTPHGEEFLTCARQLLVKVDEVENMFRSGRKNKQIFSVSVPCSSYISCAFAAFAGRVEQETQIELSCKELTESQILHDVSSLDGTFGILRFEKENRLQYEKVLQEKGLEKQLVMEFSSQIVMSEQNPLTQKAEITCEDLMEQIEVIHSDVSDSAASVFLLHREASVEESQKQIFVFERDSQYTLLQQISDSFMWSEPIPQSVLRQHHLVMRSCVSGRKLFCDVLIYKKGYQFRKIDQLFIEQLGDIIEKLDS